MEKFQYKQLNIDKAILLVIAIFILFIVAPILIFGINAIADYVNSFPNKKILGLIVGIVVILPVIFLKKYIGDKFEIVVHNGKLRIIKNGARIKDTDLKRIDSLIYSDLSTKILDIYLTDKSKFYQIKPNSLNVVKQKNDIDNIINLLNPHLKFTITDEVRKVAMANYTATIYKVIE